MSKSAKWRDRQAAYNDNRLHEWYGTGIKRQEFLPICSRPIEAPAARATPVERPEADAWRAAYGDRPITLDAAHWDDRGYMVWKAPTNQRGSRLSHSRNHPNPAND
jgi:hypothetical protein